MLSFELDLLNHVKSINACLPRFTAKATLDLQTLNLEIRARNRYHHFCPQFVARKDGRTQYSPLLSSDVIGFIGWLPYFNKRWGFASDKFDFKDFCVRNGLRTPGFWRAAQSGLRDILIKNRKSSFGVGMRGPFKTVNPADKESMLQEGEYYEEFIPGKIAKVWYWNGKVVSLEVRAMPSVTGNGAAALRELVQTQLLSLSLRGSPDWRLVKSIAAYQGWALDSVIPSGQQVLADFTYGSGLHPYSRKNTNVMAQYEGTKVEQQLDTDGRAFWQGIPADIRDNTLFTVDGIIDGEERVWLLEANCNPAAHPDLYPSVFESLFGPPQAVVDPQLLPVGPPPSATWAAPAFPGAPPSGTVWGPPPSSATNLSWGPPLPVPPVAPAANTNTDRAPNLATGVR